MKKKNKGMKKKKMRKKNKKRKQKSKRVKKMIIIGMMLRNMKIRLNIHGTHWYIIIQQFTTISC